MTARLVVSHVAKSYGTHVALRDASLELEEGEILTLLGPNGSGKTTLIKICTTLLLKDSGQVTVMGHDIDRDEHAVRRLIGYVGQDTDRSAYARLTVRENLEFFGALRGLTRREIGARIEELAASFEFGDIDRLFMTLSGGQKQTAIIIRALLCDPPIAFLDEPTKGLDPFVSRRIRSFLRRYVVERGKSVLLTSHALTEVEQLADRVALIHQGRIPIASTPAALKRSLGWQGFLDVRADQLTGPLLERLARHGATPSPDNADGDWKAFGVPDAPAALDAILETVRASGPTVEFRYRPVTLEDAFVQRIGALDERFER